jgi:outer membrane protein
MKRRAFGSFALFCLFLASHEVHAGSNSKQEAKHEAKQEAKSEIGIVNFTACITDSKLGKKEQESLENVKNQMTSLIKDIEDQLADITGKFNDPDFLDGLSPEGEQELKMKYQSLREEHDRYQGQFYQVMQQANMKLVQTVSSHVNAATDKLAKARNLSLVVNKDACFSFRESFDITNEVIAEMDKVFDEIQRQSTKEISKAETPVESKAAQ